MGNGFSKMLQMLNFDNNGNVCLNPNINNEATLNSNESNSRIASAYPGGMSGQNQLNHTGFNNLANNFFGFIIICLHFHLLKFLLREWWVVQHQ